MTGRLATFPSTAGRWQSRGASRRPQVSAETLVIAGGIFFALASNHAFFAAALSGRSPESAATWWFGAAIAVMLAALHTVLLGLLLHRWLTRPLLSLLIGAAAAASYYIGQYGIYIDPTMARNVLRTDFAEAGELLGWQMAPHMLLHAALPIALLWWVRIEAAPWRRALLRRSITLLGAAALLVVVLLLVFQDVAALMRNHKESRYLITPANVVYAVARTMRSESRAATHPRQPVGLDARLADSWAARKRPVLFVIVVGETARAANWGLNGYGRQTTPELAARGVVNFPDMRSCGSNTETSLPCMFSQIGRRDYDEDRIRHSESLLNVLDRAGFSVLWRDNQSGCKGVCSGLVEQRLDTAQTPGLCAGGRCLDEILLDGMDTIAGDANGNLVVVMHMLGNHGPAYSKRHPASFGKFGPACATDELRDCSRQQIVNAYDNALLYTDHVVARTIDFLQRQSSRYDTGLIFASDHGESLGENGLYLHGIPYAIAPDEQTRIPMVWWLSPDFVAHFGIDRACLLREAAKPASHDNLFHSVLGLLQVQTAVYERKLDLSAACRE